MAGGLLTKKAGNIHIFESSDCDYYHFNAAVAYKLTKNNWYLHNHLKIDSYRETDCYMRGIVTNVIFKMLKFILKVYE